MRHRIEWRHFFVLTQRVKGWDLIRNPCVYPGVGTYQKESVKRMWMERVGILFKRFHGALKWISNDSFTNSHVIPPALPKIPSVSAQTSSFHPNDILSGFLRGSIILFLISSVDSLSSNKLIRCYWHMQMYSTYRKYLDSRIVAMLSYGEGVGADLWFRCWDLCGNVYIYFLWRGNKVLHSL